MYKTAQRETGCPKGDNPRYSPARRVAKSSDIDLNFGVVTLLDSTKRLVYYIYIKLYFRHRPTYLHNDNVQCLNDQCCKDSRGFCTKMAD